LMHSALYVSMLSCSAFLRISITSLSSRTLAVRICYSVHIAGSRVKAVYFIGLLLGYPVLV